MTRRIRPKPDFAVPRAVEDLLSKFEYPEQRQQAPFELGRGGGGAPTVVVAAANASDLSKNKADYICTGVNDDSTINAALGRLNTGFSGNGGRLLLTEGIFNVRAAFLFLQDRVAVQGMGPSTVLACADTGSVTVISMGTRSMISDLFIDGDGGNLRGIRTQSGCMISRVWFDGLFIAITPMHPGTQVIGCNAEGSTTFIHSAVGGSEVVVANNTGRGTYDLGPTTGTALQGGIIANNSLTSGDIIGGEIRHMVIANNYIDGSILMQNENPGEWNTIQDNVLDQGSILIEHKSSMTISGNVLRRPFEHGISLDGCSQVLVSGNNIITPSFGNSNTFDGIRLAGGSSDNLLQGNYIDSLGTSWTARYGINIADNTCNCNIVVGNRLGDPAGYGTDALNDAGTDTQLFYPADPTYGDNFTACATSPTSP